MSINGGTRVEIKGVCRLPLIPELTHNEAFRQKALLEIRQMLCERVRDPDKWTLRCVEVEWDQIEMPSDSTASSHSSPSPAGYSPMSSPIG